MLKIRLKRVGRKHDPSFRIVVTEAGRGVSSNKYIERVGFYNPRTDVKEVDTERAKYWIDNGAQTTPTVHNIFVDTGVVKGEKVNVLPQKSPVVTEKPEEEKKAPAAPQEDVSTEEAVSSDETLAEEPSNASEDAPEEAKPEESPTEEPAPEESEDKESTE